MNQVELLAHPVRLRIVGALSGRATTAEELGSILFDIPQATLYRHIQKLIEGEVIRTAELRHARGGSTRLLELNPGHSAIGPDELDSADAKSLEKIFAAFFVALRSNVQSYLDLAEHRADSEGVSCRGQVFYATDAEAKALRTSIYRTLESAGRRKPGLGRRRRRACFVSIPLE